MSNRLQTCKNCKFWENDKRHMRKDEGYCHRYPPTNVWSDNDDPAYFGWIAAIPRTYPKDWCGEWSKKNGT